MTAFEDLCREWMLVIARAGQLPMVPEVVGSHWSGDAQLDVVAINWHDNTMKALVKKLEEGAVWNFG